MYYRSTLPYEILNSINVTDFDSIRYKLLTCFCGYFEHLI